MHRGGVVEETVAEMRASSVDGEAPKQDQRMEVTCGKKHHWAATTHELCTERGRWESDENESKKRGR
jgi:hypothetical protein